MGNGWGAWDGGVGNLIHPPPPLSSPYPAALAFTDTLAFHIRPSAYAHTCTQTATPKCWWELYFRRTKRPQRPPRPRRPRVPKPRTKSPRDSNPQRARHEASPRPGGGSPQRPWPPSPRVAARAAATQGSRAGGAQWAASRRRAGSATRRSRRYARLGRVATWTVGESCASGKQPRVGDEGVTSPMSWEWDRGSPAFCFRTMNLFPHEGHPLTNSPRVRHFANRCR